MPVTVLDRYGGIKDYNVLFWGRTVVRYLTICILIT